MLSSEARHWNKSVQGNTNFSIFTIFGKLTLYLKIFKQFYQI